VHHSIELFHQPTLMHNFQRSNLVQQNMQSKKILH